MSVWAVVSSKTGYKSKHSSLEVAVRCAYTGHLLVPHFLARWDGGKNWSPISSTAVLRSPAPIEWRNDADGNPRIVHPTPLLLWPVIDAMVVALGEEPLSFEDYMKLVSKAPRTVRGAR